MRDKTWEDIANIQIRADKYGRWYQVSYDGEEGVRLVTYLNADEYNKLLGPIMNRFDKIWYGEVMTVLK